MKDLLIVGVDLGTTTGFATMNVDEGGSLIAMRAWSETCPEKQPAGDRRSLDARIPYFTRGLRGALGVDPYPARLVVFEDVRFAKSLAQVQLWSSFRGALWACRSGYSHIVALPTGALKKYATGRGDADKAAMRAAAIRRWSSKLVENYDDNAVDALWLAEYGRVEIAPKL